MILELHGRTSLTPSDVASVLEKLDKLININEGMYALISDKEIKLVAVCEMIEDGLTNVKLYVSDGDTLEKILSLKETLELEIEEVIVK